MTKRITIILASILIAIIQISFFNTLDLTYSISLVLILLIFFCSLYHLSSLVVPTLLMGFILDIYNYQVFGIFIVTLLITLILADLLFNSLFTTRSLYSLISVGIISTFAYYFIFYLVNLIYFYSLTTEILLTINKDFFYFIFKNIVANCIVLIILFITTYLLSKRMKSYFISFATPENR